MFYLDKSCYFFLIVIILCGLFNNFLFYFLLLIIHEGGHAFMGIVLGYKLDMIKFYPYGAVTLFNNSLNKPLWKEFLVLISGPLMQIIAYFFIKKFVVYDYFMTYHYSLLFFNLLPIYPLDGGKLLNIFFNYFFHYRLSNKISYLISFLLLMIFIIISIINFNLNYCLILGVLLCQLWRLYKNFEYNYNHFLLERYLYNYSSKKIKCVSSIKKFHRDYFHIVKMTPEKKVLKKYFMRIF